MRTTIWILLIAALCAGCASGPTGLSETEIRKVATQFRDEWLWSTKPEAADSLRAGVIQSVERDGDVWHVTFVTQTGHGQPEGMHDYFLHVYIGSTGKLRKIVRGPDRVS